LILASLMGQLAGNVLFQWSLGVVGIALTTPLTLGTIIVSGAILGRVFLNEPVTGRAAASIVLLLAAISVLSLGAADAHRSVAAAQQSTSQSPSAGLVAAGVGAACLAGLSYSVLTVVIRYGVTGQTSISTTLFTVGLVGLISLGALSHARMGLAGMLNTDFDDLAMMLLAGVCNAAAFLALTKALQLTTIVYVNALGAAQVALSALAGIALFSEALSGAMVSGVGLTAAGLLLTERGRRRTISRSPRPADEVESSMPCPLEVAPAPIERPSVCEAE
jgi:drug/metabolite transporter (DMT)-like permease